PTSPALPVGGRLRQGLSFNSAPLPPFPLAHSFAGGEPTCDRKEKPMSHPSPSRRNPSEEHPRVQAIRAARARTPREAGQHMARVLLTLPTDTDRSRVLAGALERLASDQFDEPVFHRIRERSRSLIQLAFEITGACDAALLWTFI